MKTIPYEKLKGKHYARGNRTRGIFVVPYFVLEAAFGQPTCTTVESGAKTDVEWTAEAENGDTVSVYNYKNGTNFLGSEGKSVKDIDEWHISAPDDGYYWGLWQYLEEYKQP